MGLGPSYPPGAIVVGPSLTPVVNKVSDTQVVIGGTVAQGISPYLQASDALSVVGFTALGVAASGEYRAGRVNGTLFAPTAVVVNDQLGKFSPSGWDTVAMVVGGKLYGYAEETWSPTARGMGWELHVVRNGTTTPTRAIRVQSDGLVWIQSAAQAPGASMYIQGNAVDGVPFYFDNVVNGSGAQVGTLNNAPVAGNPAYWLKVLISGTLRRIPCW